MRRKPRKCFSHQFAQLRLGQVLVRGAIGVPQLEHADEFRLRIGELRVRGVGRPARVGRAFARILDAEERGDHQSSRAGSRGAARRSACAPASRPPAGAPSAGRSAVSWRSLVRPRRARPAAASHRRSRADRAASRNGKSSIRPRPSDSMRRITPASDGAQDFRIGVARPRLEIGLRIQAVADAGGDAAAAALALVGAGLRDRLDVQAVELLPRAVALDPRHARDRSRSGSAAPSARFRRRWSPARCGAAGPGLNTRSWSRADSRAYSGSTSVSRYLRRSSARCASRISRSPGRNTSTSPRGSSRVISSHRARRWRRCDRSRSPASILALAFRRPVAHVSTG